MLVAAERGLDSEWPPVLIAFVVLVVGAMAISAVVVFRALRRDRAGGGSKGRGSKGRMSKGQGSKERKR